MNLNRVLLIEDNRKVRDDIIAEFAAAQVEVLHVNDYENLQSKLSSLPPFQMVILDWLLDSGAKPTLSPSF